MAFNPEDFQFESITPPEEQKPILEWNSLARLIVLRVKNSDGEFEYFASKLNATVNKNLLDNMPDEWSNDNDQIINFAVYEDGEYILEKQKQKFDFVSKKSKWVRYQKEVSLYQVKELFDLLKAAIEIDRVDQEVIRTREIYDLASAESYISELDVQKQTLKTKLLRECDWSQLADATEAFTNEIALWTSYRAWLKENVKLPSDFDDILDYLIYDSGFEWPIDPVSYHEKDPDHTVEYLSVPEHFSSNIYGSGKFASAALVGDVQAAAIAMKEKLNNGGVPIARQIWNKVEKYKINEGLVGANLDNLNIVEN